MNMFYANMVNPKLILKFKLNAICGNTYRSNLEWFISLVKGKFTINAIDEIIQSTATSIIEPLALAQRKMNSFYQEIWIKCFRLYFYHLNEYCVNCGIKHNTVEHSGKK